MSRAYVFEVDDSDGYDSTQVIESAPDERTAKRRAIARHTPRKSAPFGKVIECYQGKECIA